MKTLVFKMATLCLPILATVVCINYYVDPANLLSKGTYESGIAKYLCEGYHVTNTHNFDERFLQQSLIGCLKQEPTILLLGSSRSMLIGSDLFPNGFINSAVSAASIEDYLAIYGMYQKGNLKPKTVILGLDPWLLNDNCGLDRWKSIGEHFFEMMKHIGLEQHDNHAGRNVDLLKGSLIKAREIASFTYFQHSLLMIGSMSNYWPTKELVNDNFTKHSDGSISYGRKLRDVDSIGIVNSAKRYINTKSFYALGDFSKLSKRNTGILERFIGYLTKQDIDVVLFLSPFHPIVYDYFKRNDKYKMVFETERYYRELADRYDIALLGSFSPYAYKLSNMDFYDGMHCKYGSIKTIFRNGKVSVR